MLNMRLVCFLVSKPPSILSFLESCLTPQSVVSGAAGRAIIVLSKPRREYVGSYYQAKLGEAHCAPEGAGRRADEVRFLRAT